MKKRNLLFLLMVSGLFVSACGQKTSTPTNNSNSASQSESTNTSTNNNDTSSAVKTLEKCKVDSVKELKDYVTNVSTVKDKSELNKLVSTFENDIKTLNEESAVLSKKQETLNLLNEKVKELQKVEALIDAKQAAIQSLENFVTNSTLEDKTELNTIVASSKESINAKTTIEEVETEKTNSLQTLQEKEAQLAQIEAILSKYMVSVEALSLEAITTGDFAGSLKVTDTGCEYWNGVWFRDAVKTDNKPNAKSKDYKYIKFEFNTGDNVNLLLGKSYYKADHNYITKKAGGDESGLVFDSEGNFVSSFASNTWYTYYLPINYNENPSWGLVYFGIKTTKENPFTVENPGILYLKNCELLKVFNEKDAAGYEKHLLAKNKITYKADIQNHVDRITTVTDKTVFDSILEEYKTRIDQAETQAALDLVKAEAIQVINDKEQEVITAQAVATAKQEAVQALDDYVEGVEIADKTELNDMLPELKQNIQNQTTVEDVNNAKQQALTALRNKVSSMSEALALSTAKEEANEAIDTYLATVGTYSSHTEVVEMVSAFKSEIDSSTTVEGVNTKKEEALTALTNKVQELKLADDTASANETLGKLGKTDENITLETVTTGEFAGTVKYTNTGADKWTGAFFTEVTTTELKPVAASKNYKYVKVDVLAQTANAGILMAESYYKTNRTYKYFLAPGNDPVKYDNKGYFLDANNIIKNYVQNTWYTMYIPFDYNENPTWGQVFITFNPADGAAAFSADNPCVAYFKNIELLENVDNIASAVDTFEKITFKDNRLTLTTQLKGTFAGSVKYEDIGIDLWDGIYFNDICSIDNKPVASSKNYKYIKLDFYATENVGRILAKSYYQAGHDHNYVYKTSENQTNDAILVDDVGNKVNKFEINRWFTFYLPIFYNENPNWGMVYFGFKTVEGVSRDFSETMVGIGYIKNISYVEEEPTFE